MNRRGISLIELLFTSLMGVIVLLAAGYLLQQFSRGQNAIFGRSNLESDMEGLLESILLVGKLSTACTRATGAPPNDLTLECQVDFEAPPQGNRTTIQFVWDRTKETVTHRRQDRTTLQWSTVRTFTNIIDFVVCSDAEMTTTPTCTILNNAMSIQHATFRAKVAPLASPANRFFRFRIKGLRRYGVNNSKDDLQTELQSAFFVRNADPKPYNLTHQWGYRQ